MIESFQRKVLIILFTYQCLSNLFSFKVRQLLGFEAFKVFLKSGVGVGITEGKLVYIIFFVKGKYDGQHIAIAMLRAAVIKNTFGGNASPKIQKHFSITRKR